MPDWETIQNAWPVIIAVALAWARVEVALRATRKQSEDNADKIREMGAAYQRELLKMEAKVDNHTAVSQQQAIQLARMEQALVAIGATLERLDKRLSGG